MPTASAAYRSGGYATTYGTSYTSSSVSRSSSATRRTSLSNGYSSSSNATSQYRASRPLPPGPGPLDRHGRKLDGYTLASFEPARRAARASPVGSGLRSGPLKADHTTGSRYAAPDRTTDHVSGASTLNRKNSRTGLDPLLGSSTPTTTTTTTTTTTSGRFSSGRRSASLANLRIEDEPPTSIYSKARFESDDRIGQRPSSRRGSRFDDDFQVTSPRVGRTVGIGGEDKKDGGSGRSNYTPSVSRESSPGTSNGIGSRVRPFRDPREESSHSKSSSQSSSCSSTANVSVSHSCVPCGMAVFVQPSLYIA